MSYPLPGDFGLLTTPQGRHRPLMERFAEWAICFGTDSPAYHAFLAVGDGKIIEAVRHVQVSDASSYENVTWSSGRLPAQLVPSSEEREEIVAVARAWAIAKVGYNVVDILAIALAQKRLGGEVDSDDWIARRLNDDSHLICSQAVSQAYLRAGITLVPGKIPGLVAPGDLYNLLLPAMVP